MVGEGICVLWLGHFANLHAVPVGTVRMKSLMTMKMHATAHDLLMTLYASNSESGGSAQIAIYKINLF